MKFSFLVLTWNRYKFLEICLSALIASLDDPSACEIVVMDNGSTDATRDVLARFRDNPLVRSILLPKNHGIAAYKRLLRQGRGDFLVVVDDDVLTFPPHLDRIFSSYMQAFPDYGYLVLNVLQNEFTNGAKPGPEAYTDDTRDGMTIQRGPAGGWCSCFRKRDFDKLRLRLLLTPLSMKRGEDSFLVNKLRKLGLDAGIIKDFVCFHATGPHYAREFGHLDREIEKYARSGLQSFVDHYKHFSDKP